MKQVTLHNAAITLIVLDYGAIIQKLLIKDRDGRLTNVVVGYDFPSRYPDDQRYLGACVGRYAGRISNGKFLLDRQTFLLHEKKGVHLHGGKEGFGKKTWTIESVEKGAEPAVTMSYVSRHLEEGYPGKLKATVTYRLVGNELHIQHRATTDRTTVINLVNHSYFRLDDAPAVDAYRLQLNCGRFAETHPNLLPTGKLLDVAETEYDFRTERNIGTTRLDTPFEIDSPAGKVGRLMSERTGIFMEVVTNQPAVVVYTPPDLPAICFETQNFPDAPNHSNFPSSVLRPGEVYKNDSRFIFGVL